MNTQPDQEDVKFAKSLVNPDKSIRDKTLATFKKHISSLTSVEHMEMLKIWKALYYCMWLSDKQPIQAELAQRLCDIMDDFSTQQLSLLYLRMFFRIMMREWAHLDQYRVNKFYSLIRLMFRKALTIASEASWSSDLAGAVLAIIDEEALTKKPNGIRFHLADIYLSELHTVTNGEITSKDILIVLQPLHASLLRLGDHAVFIERVCKEVFTKYATQYAAENAASSEEEEEEEGNVEPTPKTLFNNVNTKVLQKWLFDTASEETTPDFCRKKLYDLHKAFATRTGSNFVSESIEDMLAAEGGKTKSKATPAKKAKKAEVATPVAPTPATTTTTPAPAEKKEKKSKRTISEVEDVPTTSVMEKSAKKKNIPAAVPAEEAVDPVSSKKEKKVKKSSKEEESVEETSTTPALKSAMKSTKALTESKTPNTSNKSAKKSEDSSPSAVATSATTAAAAAAPVKTVPPTFIASAKFSGRKEGYMFQKGKSGIGYYWDAVQARKAARKSVSGNNNNNSNNSSSSSNSAKKGSSMTPASGKKKRMN